MGSYLFAPPKFFALVLNISLRPRVADEVKKELIDFVNTFEEEDQFYLSTNASRDCDRNDIVDMNGKRVAMIGNWRPKEVSPSLNLELRKALQAIEAHGDKDGEGYICLIADRYKNDHYIPQILNQNTQIWCDVKLIVVTIGDHYSFKEYQHECNIFGCKYIHLSTPSGIKAILCHWTGGEK